MLRPYNFETASNRLVTYMLMFFTSLLPYFCWPTMVGETHEDLAK